MKYKRRKFDSNSLKFKLWLYFMCFAALIMAVVWLAQVYMLNNSYEDMKTNLEGVFAAGDVRKKKLRQVVTAVSDGAVAAVQAGKYIDEQ